MNDRSERHTGMPSAHWENQKHSLQIPRSKMDCRRVSLCVFCRGSLTLEAAMVLPFVLCAVTALLYVFLFTAIQAEAYRKQTEQAEFLAATVGQDQSEDPYIRLSFPQMAGLPFRNIFPAGKLVVQQTVVRAWVGYTGESFQMSASEELVYITPEGEVCHRSRDCTYLRLSIRQVLYGEIQEARNRSGEKYAPCEYCVKDGKANAVVYVTDYGNRYHSVNQCQGLKRTVMAVPWSEAGGRPLCSKCGKQ